MAKLKTSALFIRSLVAVGGALFLSQSPHALALDWVPVGSAPAINGGDEGITSPEGPNPIAGAINSFAPSPTDANTLYVATVNGGVWKTTNAKDPSPKWVPLTDNNLPSLSLASIAVSPLDAKTILVGAGRTSSLANNGGAQFGLGRSTDSGQTWTVVGTNLADQEIRAVLPTRVLEGGKQVVLVASQNGIYRSVDGGVTYTQVSNGIPTSPIADLAGDPGVNTRFYASTGGKVYKSDDAGLSWTEVSTGTGFTVVADARILLSVHNSVGADVVYAAVIDAGALANVYRSADQGVNWTALAVPAPAACPGKQCGSQGALLADRTSATTVYFSGDRQVDGTEEGGTQQFPNSLGANNYVGSIWRNVNGTWESVTANGANGTGPHADSRAMLFDADGNILQSNDGGIFKLNDPNGTTNADKNGTRRWSSLNGNISSLESHNATFDPISRVFLNGAQDNGVLFQIKPGDPVWNVQASGDGGRVEVDSDQTAHNGTSIRYSSNQNFSPFNRLSFNAANTVVGDYTTVKLNIVSGEGAGKTLGAFEKLGFLQPFVVNQVDPKRLLIGIKYIYESLDMGDSLANLGLADATAATQKNVPYQAAANAATADQGIVGDDTNTGTTSMAYGGRLNGTAVPDVFYVGAGTRISHRVAMADPIAVLTSYPGGIVRVIAMDPQNYKRIFVLDATNKVFTSVNEGVTWTEITANLGTFTDSVRTIEIFNTDPNFANGVLYAGGLGGVWKMANPTGNSTWVAESGGLPSKVLVYDLRYDYTSNVLTAGTLGRGVYGLGAGVPTASPTPSPSPTASPGTTPTQLGNISTRLRVETGDNALIGGFIITGTQPKKVIIRGIGPSLPFPDKLANPTLELRNSSSSVDFNDDWVNSKDKQAIIDSGVAPNNDLESAVIAVLPANNSGYTAIVRGANDTTGIGVVEAYDLDRSVDSKLANISTRGFVGTDPNILIAGTIVLGSNAQKVIVRAIGPSLPIPGKLENPILELRDASGTLIRSNDDWRTGGQEAEIIASLVPPTDDKESAIVATLPAANASYTAIVRGVDGTTGIAVVEIYALAP